MQDAETILRPLNIPDDLKAQAWDAYHDATDPDDFAVRIVKINLPNEAKAALWDLKESDRIHAITPATAQRPALSPEDPQYAANEHATAIADSIRTLGDKLIPAAKKLAIGSVETLGALDENPVGTLYDIAKTILGGPGKLIESMQKFKEGRTSGDAGKMAEGTTKFITEAAPALLGLEGAIEPIKSGITARSAIKAERAGATDILKKANPQSFQPWSDTVGDLFKTKDNQFEFDKFNSTFDDAAQHIQSNAKRILGSDEIRGVRAFSHVGKQVADETYVNEVIIPASKVDIIDLRPYARDMISRIPDWYTKTDRVRVTKAINEDFNRTMSGRDAAMKLKEFNAANIAHTNATTYAQSTADALPNGHMLNMATDAIRDALSDAVKRVDPNADIAASLKKYGNLTEVVQRAGGEIPIDPKLMEILAGHSYITGTAPNFYGRAAQALTQKWRANDALMRRAMARYKESGPLPKPEPAPYSAYGPQRQLESGQYDMPQFTGMERLYGIQPSSAPGVGIPLRDITKRTADPMLRALPEKSESTLAFENPTSTTPLGYKFERVNPKGTPMPEVSESTRFNTRQIGTGAIKSLPPAPFEYEVRGTLPKSIRTASTVEPPAKLAKIEDPAVDPRLPIHYQSNWQLSGEVKGTGGSTSATGQGTLKTTNPKVVESTIQALQREIETGKLNKTTLAEYKADIQYLLGQLKKGKAARGIK